MEQAKFGELALASFPARASLAVLGSATSADTLPVGILRHDNVASPSANVNVTKDPALIEAFRRFSTADWIVACTALFIILNGFSICVGWWARIPILVQLYSNDAPTHFNTALGFILLGFGELGLVLRRRGVVIAMAGTVICLASAELAQYAFHMSIGIDTFLAVPFVSLDALYPGRMSGNTIACFLLISGAQFFMSKPDRDAGSATTAAVIMKTLAGGIAFVAMLGYVVDLKSAYGWSESVGMSIRSWAGFLLVIIARIAALWQRDIVNKPSLPGWFLPFLGISVLTISVGLIWLFSSPSARPFMLDPAYAATAHRRSIAMLLGVGTLIMLGAISVLVARHKAMIALQQAADLSLEVLKRTEAELELRDNNQQLERSNRDLEDFAYIASHDLRTPLNGINSTALCLEEDLQDSLSDESRKLLGLMRSRINRMEALLDDLLTYSRVGRTDTAVSETKLADIFDHIIAVLHPPAHIQVRVEGEMPVIVTASAQLEQVLRNLINNAIKHHDKQNGEVVVCAKRVGDFVEFVVRDDGPGILPQFHDKIFQLFQTLKRRGEVESTGMGLAIVKKLVERQKCLVTVHSEGDGTGSQFRFQWPIFQSTVDAKETIHV
jgi:signal transduction histidine kinase